MSESNSRRIPKTKPAAAGAPPRPPKKTARDLADESPEEPHVDIPDPIAVRDLASKLQQKPFMIIADLMELGEFRTVRATVGFALASKVALKHGFHARRVVS
jgi:translation initiation factor IF-2